MKNDNVLEIFQHLLSLGEDNIDEHLASIISKEHKHYNELVKLISAHKLNKVNTSFKSIIHESSDILVENDMVHNLEGTQVGPYSIVNKLGEGGMGVVYLGERNDGQLAQKVAIKFLYPSIIKLSGSSLLNREAQYLANLDHANIAKIFTIGKINGNLPYMVMEYIDGIPLDQYCNLNKLNLKKRLILFIKVCNAVQHAHQNMVIHADIKPSNILVNKQGEPKLMDFGIANSIGIKKNLEREVIPLRAASRDFSSPEQLNGESLNITSDIFSAGKVLQLLLNTDSNCSSIQRKWFRATVQKCLDPNIEARVPDFNQLSIALSNILNYQKPRWIKANLIESSKAFVLRNPALTALTLVFLVSNVTFIATLLSKNQLLHLQNESNKKIVSFLSNLFRKENALQDNVNVFELLSSEKQQINNHISLKEKPHNSPFLPAVFANHSVNINEKISLKIMKEININHTIKVNGVGLVDNQGFFHANFDRTGIYKTEITVEDYMKINTLTLNFIVKNDKDMPLIFEDVSVDDPSFGDIHYLAIKGILIGRPVKGGYGRVFAPDQYVKQAEVLKIIFMAAHERGIVNLFPSNLVYDNLISIDSDGGIEDFSWAATFLEAAKKLGVLHDMSLFSPKDLSTRIWVANMLVKVLKLFNPEEITTEKLDFTDKQNFASEDEYLLAKTTAFYNLLGNAESAFLPKNPMTRREVAAIASKLLQLPITTPPISSEIVNGQAESIPIMGRFKDLQTPAYKRIGNSIIALDNNDINRTKISLQKITNHKLVIVLTNTESNVSNSVEIPLIN